MRVHQHSSTNMLLARPPDMPNCNTVPATLILDDDNTVRICTFWRPTSEELEQLNHGHSICLHVYGKLHVPVAITVEAP